MQVVLLFAKSMDQFQNYLPGIYDPSKLLQVALPLHPIIGSYNLLTLEQNSLHFEYAGTDF